MGRSRARQLGADALERGLRPRVGTGRQRARGEIEVDRTVFAPPRPAAVEVEIVDSLDEWGRWREEWDALALASPTGSPFLTWTCLSEWWRIYGGDAPLRVLLVFEGRKRLIGATAIRVARTSGRLGATGNRLEFVGDRYVAADGIDVLYRPDRVYETLRAVLDALSAEVPWTTWAWRSIPADSSTIDALRAIAADRGIRIHEERGYRCPVIRLPDSYLAYLKSRRRSFRHRLTRQRKRLEREHRVEITIPGTEAEVRTAFERLVEMNLDRLGSRRIASRFLDERFRSFHERTWPRLHRRGGAFMVELRIDGEVAAACYLYRWGRRVLAYQSGFDRRFARLSPGTTLMSHLIEMSIEEGDEELDLLRGTERYKWLWCDEHRRHARWTLFAPGLAGGVIRHTRRLRSRFVHLKRHGARWIRSRRDQMTSRRKSPG